MPKVKIKTWNKMKEQYGLDDTGSINISQNLVFCKDMEADLPKDRVIEIDEKNQYNNHNWNTWEINEKMIEEKI